MDEVTADRITQLAASLMLARDSITVTNGQFLRFLLDAMKAAFEMGKKYGKNN